MSTINPEDPIYAVIERHKAASAVYGIALEHPDVAHVIVATPEAEDVVGRTLDALVDAAERLLAFQARTLPGVASQLRYLAELTDQADLPSHFTDDFGDMKELCATLAAAIEAIIQRGQA